MLEKKWNKEYLLNAGEAAPVRGVLVPEYNYREYQKSFEMRFNTDPGIDYPDLLAARQCPVCIEKKVDINGYALSFTLGALATALVLPALLHR